MFFYKQYPYAPRATFVSVAFSLVSLGFIMTAIALFLEGFREKEYVNCVITVLIAAAGVAVYIFGSRKLADRIARKDGVKNLRTKAKYALRYVRTHPEAYEQMLRENPDFAAKYVRSADGKIVRR